MVRGLFLISLCAIGILIPRDSQAERYHQALECLTRIVYNESRGEPEKGQMAVAFVVENRINSEEFPDKYCEVIKQSGQFAYVKRINRFSPEWKKSREVAALFLKTKDFMDDPTDGATYFLKKGSPKPKWMKGGKKVKKTAVISKHVFFRRKK